MRLSEITLEMRVNETHIEVASDQIKSPETAKSIFQALAGNKDREHFYSLMLDTKNQVKGYHCVSMGSLNAAIVHPREVFKAAILANAASVILCHNHPSGNVIPSREDKEITERLVEVGEILGIKVLDHIVVSYNDYYSFKANGDM